MILQLLLNGLVKGCDYALLAIGFGIIYNTTSIFHLAHGAIYTLSAYIFFSCYVLLNWHFVPAACAAVAAAAAAGALTNKIVYEPLLERRASPLVSLLSSLGVYTIVVNSIVILYGGGAKTISSELQPTLYIGSLVISKIRLVWVIVFAIICVTLAIILEKTNWGRVIRAMRDDTNLVAAMGMNPRNVRYVIFAVGSALAAAAAIPTSIDVGMAPHFGMVGALNGVVALIIGGVGSTSLLKSAVVGGLFLGMLQSMVAFMISDRWASTFVFVTLILFLIFRPEGIWGQRRRVEEVKP